MEAAHALNEQLQKELKAENEARLAALEEKAELQMQLEAERAAAAEKKVRTCHISPAWLVKGMLFQYQRRQFYCKYLHRNLSFGQTNFVRVTRKTLSKENPLAYLSSKEDTHTPGAKKIQESSPANYSRTKKKYKYS